MTINTLHQLYYFTLKLLPQDHHTKAWPSQEQKKVNRKKQEILQSDKFNKYLFRRHSVSTYSFSWNIEPGSDTSSSVTFLQPTINNIRKAFFRWYKQQIRKLKRIYLYRICLCFKIWIPWFGSFFFFFWLQKPFHWIIVFAKKFFFFYGWNTFSKNLSKRQ